MAVKDRVKAYCETMHMTVSAFEKSIGVANGYVNSISKSIGIDKISLILEKYPNLSIEWLLTGRGEMLKIKHTPETPTPKSEPASNNKSVKQDFSTSFIDKLFAIINEKENTIREQAEEIGRLRACNDYLECKLERREAGEKVASGAPSSGLAGVG